MAYTSGKIDQFTLEELKLSEKTVGQIYPVVLDAKGRVIDGSHRKRANPNWKTVQLPIEDDLEALRLRVHLNIERRQIDGEEKGEWITGARKLLQARGLKGAQEEVAEALGMSRPWVSKYDPDPIQHQEHIHEDVNVPRRSTFSVWGFKDESWRKEVLRADPGQPDMEFYHGATPAFVIENLLARYKPNRVLDSMAGIGTTGWVCARHGIECDQYDLYPYPKYGVKKGDAEFIEAEKPYNLIFNHPPYLDMVKYGDDPEDLSNQRETAFFDKLRRVFKRNLELLEEGGIYAVLIGDRRSGGQLVPLTARTELLGLEVGFTLFDAAVKLTGESKSTSGLIQYRAEKFGFMIPAYDTIIIFKRVMGL